MKKAIFLQSGGGWSTNIGNAILDMGTSEYLNQSAKKAGKDIEIHVTSALGKWLFHNINKFENKLRLKKNVHKSNFFDLSYRPKADFVVQWGSILSKNWLDSRGRSLYELSKRGTKVLLIGCGMGDGFYSTEEISKTREYLKKIHPLLLISRDESTFKNFSDLADFSFNGIDCGFWVNDAYKPPDLDLPRFRVLNFDKELEPTDLSTATADLIIRTHHSIWHNFALNKYPKMLMQYYFRQNTFLSDHPHDYLMLYANTSATYSDRVHACVATISYGNAARLYGEPERAQLFDRVGSAGITNCLTKPDSNKIKIEKKRQIDFLVEIFRKYLV